MRGRAMLMSRSSISYMRSPRRVTRSPTGMPARSLKLATDLRARRICAFCPVIWPSCIAASSMALASCVPSPMPMLRVTLVTLGTCMTFL